MENFHTIIFIVLATISCYSCSKDEEGTQTLGDADDISVTSDITPYGGDLQVSDESGNAITLSFPPGALRDTTTVTLNIIGEHMDLPIDERHIRAFEVLPSDLSLYVPVTVSIVYNSGISEIQESAIYRIRSDNGLSALGDHLYPNGNNTVTARTLILGKFAEGKLTVEQINAQLDLLASSMGIDYKNTGTLAGSSAGTESGCEEYKAVWDDWVSTASAFVKFFNMRYLLGYYNNLPPGSRTWEEDIQKVCENIIQQGIAEVLKLGQPSDPCCPDYAHTMESMMTAMTGCNLEGSTSDQLSDQYNQVHSQCHTYLDITTELDVASGGFMVMTAGEVIVTLEGTGNHEASVSGMGDLDVTGSSYAGGQCSATISGQTFVNVTGTRDAGYVYMLSIQMDQYAMMTTVCPEAVIQTPLIGGSAREVTLDAGNNFSLLETEEIDEGTVTVHVTLYNPYIPVPDPE